MSDKKTEIDGIKTDDLPLLVEGARFASVSTLDEFINEVFRISRPETPVDIRPKK